MMAYNLDTALHSTGNILGGTWCHPIAGDSQTGQQDKKPVTIAAGVKPKGQRSKLWAERLIASSPRGFRWLPPDYPMLGLSRLATHRGSFDPRWRRPSECGMNSGIELHWRQECKADCGVWPATWGRHSPPYRPSGVRDETAQTPSWCLASRPRSMPTPASSIRDLGFEAQDGRVADPPFGFRPCRPIDAVFAYADAPIGSGKVALDLKKISMKAAPLGENPPEGSPFTNQPADVTRVETP